MSWWWIPVLVCRPPRRRRRPRRSKWDKEEGHQPIIAATTASTTTGTVTTASSTIGPVSLLKRNVPRKDKKSYHNNNRTTSDTSSNNNDDEIPLLKSHKKHDLARKQRRQDLENSLIQAIQTGNVAQARTCLRQGKSSMAATTECNGRPLLYLAVRNNNSNSNNQSNNTTTEMIQLLLHHGAPVNAVTAEGQHSALHATCFSTTTQVAAAKLLLAAGADVNARNAAGTTPLYWAAKLGHAPMVQLLLDKGACLQLPFAPSPFDVAHERVLPLLRKATFWGLVLTRHGFGTPIQWFGRIVVAVETLSQAQILALILKLGMVQGLVSNKQVQGWMKRAMEKLSGSYASASEPEPPGWRALVHDCRKEGLLGPKALPHVKITTTTSPTLLHNQVHQITLGLAFLEELNIALTQNPVHLAALDGSSGALYKHLLLFCRALLRTQAAREAGLPHLTETCAMEVTARAVVLVLQLAQMGRHCPTLTAVWGHLHWLDQGQPVETMLLAAPAARRAMTRGKVLGQKVLEHLEEESVYVRLGQATTDVGVLLGVVTTMLEHGVVLQQARASFVESKRRDGDEEEEKHDPDPVVVITSAVLTSER